MNILRPTDEGQSIPLLDRMPFKLAHGLCEHPSLTLANLARVLPALPERQVMYSDSLLSESDNFEVTFRKRPANRTIEETIETIRERESYIMVRSPEVDPSFAELYRELIADVEQLMVAQGLGRRALRPQLYLFIASPNSVTPFHIDRYSTLLLQIRGSKTVTVFPQWTEQVVTHEQRERYVSYEDTSLDWNPAVDRHGRPFDFHPGEALHIPFVAGHHVRNGPGDVSISMSIIFNTDESMMWLRAILFNHRARAVMRKFGLEPSPVGASHPRDAIKSTAWRVRDKVVSLRSAG